MPGDADAIVVGSGPNGLAAAVTLAAAGVRVHVIEGAATPGGGCRTEELTLPGFRHDLCSAAHPLAIASPFFRRFGPAARGVRFAHPEVVYAHPLDGGRAAVVTRSVTDTATRLGADAAAYLRLMQPLTDGGYALADAVLSSMRRPPRYSAALAAYARHGPALRGRGGPAVRHGGGPRPVRRGRGARDAAAGRLAHGGRGPAARLAGAYGRLAGGGRRQRPAHRRHDRGHRRRRWAGGDRPLGAVAGRPAARGRDAARRRTAHLPRPRRRDAASPLPRRPGQVPLRRRRVQGRLRPRRARSPGPARRPGRRARCTSAAVSRR